MYILPFMPVCTGCSGMVSLTPTAEGAISSGFVILLNSIALPSKKRRPKDQPRPCSPEGGRGHAQEPEDLHAGLYHKA